MRKLLFILLILAAACSKDPTSDTRDPQFDFSAASMDIMRGDYQEGVVADTLGLPCVVELTAPTQIAEEVVPVPGALINFVVTEGGGSVFAGAALTDSAGKAADLWILGTTAGPQQMQARAVASDGTPITYATFNATALPGPAATLIRSPQDTLLFVGQSLKTSDIRVSAADQYGNAVSEIAPSLELTGDPGLMLAGDEIMAVAEGAGALNITDGDAFVSVGLFAAYDMRDFNWTLESRYYDNPNVHDSGGYIVGADSTFVTFAGDSIIYISSSDIHTPIEPSGATARVRIFGHWSRTTWLSTGEIHTEELDTSRIITRVIPDRVDYDDLRRGDVSGFAMAGLPRVYVGGRSGGRLGFDWTHYLRWDPTVLTGTLKP